MKIYCAENCIRREKEKNAVIEKKLIAIKKNFEDFSEQFENELEKLLMLIEKKNR